MSFFKYFNEAGGAHTEHNGSLQWARNGEYPPLRNTNQVALTEAEVEAIEQYEDFHCKAFELWNEEHLKAYCEIQDRIINGWYTLLFIDRKYLDEHKGWRVLLEWSQSYAEIPPSKVPSHLRAPVATPTVSLLQGSPHPAAAG